MSTIEAPQPGPSSAVADAGFGPLDPRLEAIGRRVSADAVAIEAARRLPADVVDALIDTGVFRSWVPAAHGGGERPLAELLRDIEHTAYHDGSLGWCVMIGGTSSLLSGFLDPHWARTVFGDPRAVIGGYAMPQGTARVVDGGLEVTGRWPWGSGTDHCTWIGGGVLVVDDDGKPTARADGLRAPYVLFPAEAVEIVDVWRTSGLRATASNDYQVTKLFVPEGCWGEFLRAAPVADGPLYRLPFTAALGLGVACVGLGLARRALDELVTVASTKKPALSSRVLAERATVQADVARAEARMGAASSYLRELVADAWDRAERGDAPTADQRRRLRLAATFAMESAATCVDACYHAAGGSAIWEDAALQRVFRDVHVATQHGMVAPRTLEPIGRMRLGLPTDAGQF
ncbi:MAG: acyl-CoA dehydrogenase family protein [Acidimicrobiia bacterium]